MVAALGNAKEYTLKQYLAFADKLQAKAKVGTRLRPTNDKLLTTFAKLSYFWSSEVFSATKCNLTVLSQVLGWLDWLQLAAD